MYVSKIEGAFHQSIEGCTDTAIAAGLSASEMTDWMARAGAAMMKLQADYAGGKLPLLDVACDIEKTAKEIEETYQRLEKGAEKIVFFGTGGSNLGGQTLAQFGGWNIPGSLDKDRCWRPATRFYGNLDPATMIGVLSDDDLASQRFVLMSKSGGTSETLSQTIAILDTVINAGLKDKIPEMFLAVSDPDVAGKTNGLRQLCKKFAIPVLDHPPGIGGRFSVLTCVGLLPAITRGLNIKQLLYGAKAVVSNVLAARTAQDCPAAIGAAIANALYHERMTRVHVMMPYADRLAQLARWHVQLWAESLGKNGQGTTPLACLGPLDQHSMLQLFMDGPGEYYLTFIRTPLAGLGPRLSQDLCAVAGFDIMAGKTIGDLVHAQSIAVPQALRQTGRPTRIIDLPELNEFALGALLMHFMIETIIAGHLMDVDPFGQPAVELGKQLTLKYIADKY